MGDSSTAVLTINIIDVNDEVPVINGSNIVDIDEEQPIGSTVPLVFVAEDLDANDVLRYSISGMYLKSSTVKNIHCLL